MHVAVSGLGTTGQQIANQLSKLAVVSSLRLYDPKPDRVTELRSSIATVATYAAKPTDHIGGPAVSVAILAGPARTQISLASELLAAGCHVISISDDIEDVQDLLQLDDLARLNRVTMLVGAGFCPGLTGLLVAYGSAQLDLVDAINVATTGTGGPACARQHHRALKHDGLEWNDGEWVRHRGRSGRDLAWFPDPIGANDCYRAALASPLLIQEAFPQAGRIGARMSANRRDSLTSRLPMLKRPHVDGGPGAVRAEIRGRIDSSVETKIYGAVANPSTAAATVATFCAEVVINAGCRFGAYGLASVPNPSEFLVELHSRGIAVSSFDGYLQSVSGPT